jgi:arsenate reductase
VYHNEKGFSMTQKPRVLFICVGNSARSQMAEAFLSRIGSNTFDVFSAGLEPSVVNPYTIQVLKESGIDWSNAQSKGLEDFLGKVHFGYVITVCSRAEQRCPIFPGMGQRLHWPFDDPAAAQGSDEEKLVVFRRVRDQIESKINEWYLQFQS